MKEAFLPHVARTTDVIGRLLKEKEIKTVFKSANKVRDLIRPFKGVYEIPCNCGSVYVGDTKRLVPA